MSCCKSSDVVASEMPEVSWSDVERIASLRAIHNHVTQEARNAIRWYLSKKWSKKWGSRILRILVAVFALAAGLIPLLEKVITRSNGEPLIDPLYVSVAILAGVTVIGLDRLIGCSSGWMRYMKTELGINRLLQAFEIDWESGMLKLSMSNYDNQEIVALLEKARVFTSNVADLLVKESAEWANELTLTLTGQEKKIESMQKTLEEAGESKAGTADQQGTDNRLNKLEKEVTELHTNVFEQLVDINQGISVVKNDVKEGFAEFEGELSDLRTEVQEQIKKLTEDVSILKDQSSETQGSTSRLEQKITDLQRRRFLPWR